MRYSPVLLFLGTLLLACGAPSESGTVVPTSTMMPLPAPDATAPVGASSSPTPVPTGIPLPPSDSMVWPTLRSLNPPRATPGDAVVVTGYGGYAKVDGGDIESPRAFYLSFDGQFAGSLGCYVNRCEGHLTVPAGATPGTHLITVEGGASLVIQVAPPKQIPTPGKSSGPVPTPTAPSEPPPTPTATVAPEPAPTRPATPTETPTPSPTTTPAPTSTTLPAPTATFTPAPTPTSTATPPPAATPTPTATATGVPLVEGVVIVCIRFDGEVPRTEADEYVQIANTGDTPVELEDWRLVDVADGSPTFTFPAHLLQPGETVRVHTNQEHTEWGGFSFRYGIAIWNNSEPDAAGLFNAQGVEVSRKTYPPGC